MVFTTDTSTPLVSKVEPREWSIETIPSFCITLERREDRWKRFQDQPGIKGLHLKRFVGVDGKTLDIKTEKRVATFTKRNIISNIRRSHEELDTIGGVGCALSHIAVWQWMVDNHQQVCLVFEDDALVPPDFIEKANRCIETTLLKNTKQWDMWLLGGKWTDMSHIPKQDLIRIERFVLFHAYVITLDTAKRLLEDVYPIHGHIDVWTSVYASLNGIRVVGSNSLKIKQSRDTKTDIQPEEKCEICNVPAAFHKTDVIVPKIEYQLGKIAQVVSVVLIGYLIYKKSTQS